MSKNKSKGADKQQKDQGKPDLPGRPFQPGQSGNPAGRPPSRTVKKEIREAAVAKVEEWFLWIFLKPEEELQERMIQGDMGLSTADKLMLKNVDRATVDALLDRIMGKPTPAKTDDSEGGMSAEDLLRSLINANGGNNG